MNKPRIEEVIVVEGRYDKNILSQVVDATIVETGGFSVFNDREKLELLRKLAQKRGLILLTDSDGAGFVIRNYLKGVLPKRAGQAGVYPGRGWQGAPQAQGRQGGKAGRGGDDAGGGAIPAPQRRNLRRGQPPRRPAITKADLLDQGLIGQEDARRRGWAPPLEAAGAFDRQRTAGDAESTDGQGGIL